MNAKNFGLVMTSLVRPTVHTQSHNTIAPVFVWREVARTQNIKSIYMYSLDMLTNVEKREKENRKAGTIKQSST